MKSIFQLLLLCSLLLQTLYGQIERSLKQNFPNPFNPTTIIEFSLPTPSFTKVSVFNSIGQEVAVLKNEMLNPGIYKVKFNAANLSSGLYLYKIQSGDFIETKKMNFIK